MTITLLLDNPFLEEDMRCGQLIVKEVIKKDIMDEVLVSLKKGLK